MSQNKPSDSLTKPRRPLLVGGVITAVVIGLSGIGAGAYAIGQAVTAEPTATVAPQSEPTYTPAPNAAPVAIIHASVSNLKVTVDGSSTVDGDGEVVEFAWDFGDGVAASGATASHTYGAAGTYTVTLTVTDDEGASDATTQEVTTTAPAPPPPPPPSAPVFGQYPSGYLVPNIPGTDQPDTTACASSAAYTGSDGRSYCA